MGRFFKIWPNLSQNWLKFKKILEKIGNFVQNLAQNWADWYMNGLLFLEKLVFVWVYFQIPGQHIPTKTKLEYPPGPLSSLVDNSLPTLKGTEYLAKDRENWSFGHLPYNHWLLGRLSILSTNSNL